MKIVILGGTGYVGHGLMDILSTNTSLQLVSMSRSGGTQKDIIRWPSVTWLKIDLYDKQTWKAELQDADWVIDLIGILFAKNYSEYYSKTIDPVMNVIKYLEKENTTTKFLFVSANYAPPGMHNYMQAKKNLEKELSLRLGTRASFVYPGLIYHSDRPLVNITGTSLALLQKIPILKKVISPLRPIARDRFATEINQIITGNSSFLQQRTEK
ncbi:NAD-dependent epimerase/dehydratase family protein [Ligilactobacillus sp. WILCCON 0076]|uniref:NAD-dependent epimerase/dehydratase family protein n=1 Tax=Ligilactobacillus ubinensis TaxID=2876789 RepID=A0A9X2JLJ0_9LACO|nr:NAD-dependent epimerase/dehydratase family protein [Ligilactobacillus ubinensis]MCP0886650.1 NAD-dependent epimerase/dehydratase family protein [Ligilactobacillus ubinensis]